jgi:hypothetical protein
VFNLVLPKTTGLPLPISSNSPNIQND